MARSNESQAARPEPTATATENTARNIVTTSSVPPSTVFTSGGSQSNLQALLMARNHVYETLCAGQSGDPLALTQALSRLRIFTSDVSHFSIGKSASILGLGYEVTGDTTSDNPQIRRFQKKFQIPWILLHAGASIVEETAASLPQLHGFTAYPTTLFLGRDGRIREVYAGFRGPATGAQHTRQIADYRDMIERLLREP